MFKNHPFNQSKQQEQKLANKINNKLSAEKLALKKTDVFMIFLMFSFFQT